MQRSRLRTHSVQETVEASSFKLPTFRRRASTTECSQPHEALEKEHRLGREGSALFAGHGAIEFVSVIAPGSGSGSEDSKETSASESEDGMGVGE